MHKEYVRVVCNVYCRWEGLPPNYRVYVNDELFTERTWTWDNSEIYLQETLQIEAKPGEYQIRYELVPPNLAEIVVGIPTIEIGAATITEKGLLRITDASA
jgi:hypothetical protein